MVINIVSRRVLLLLSIIFIYQSADAQYKFNISMSWDYNCHGNKQCEEVVRMYHSIVNGYLSKSNINFNSKSECEAARNMLIGNINEIKTMANQNRVKLNYTVSPCTGADGGKFVFLGPNRGTSFYSTNSANEIKNWSEDYIEQQLALNPEGQLLPSKSVQTNDVSFDKERADLRNEFVIDPDKPFQSININESGEMNSQSADFNSTEWEFFKSTHNLTDKDVNTYKNRLLSNAEELLNDILLTNNNINRENLEAYIKSKYLDLYDFALRENNRYMHERAILNKARLLAKFKVDYKAILNLKYIDAVDENSSEVESAFLFVNGKTKEQYYNEELKKHEQELLKSGISQNDIDRIKSQTDKEAIVKDYSSKVKDIAEGAEQINDLTFSSKIASNILSGISSGITIGVLINNLITNESYKIVSEALDKQIKNMDENFQKTDDFINTQLKNNKNLDTLLKYTSSEGQTKVKHMNDKDRMLWGENFEKVISEIERQITSPHSEPKRSESGTIFYYRPISMDTMK